VWRDSDDTSLRAAACALAEGDPLGALKLVALREDAPALALRGIAMAQLGDFVRARNLLQRAARKFGAKDVVARARCVVAEAEVALASRELGWPTKALESARATLEEHGDRANAAHARLLEARRLALIGRLDEAERALGRLAHASVPPATRAIRELVVAGIALRRLRTQSARDSLGRAHRAARASGIPALVAEVESVARVLAVPAARLRRHGTERLLMLADVETLLASSAFVVDACRNAVSVSGRTVSLASRPVLFTLVRALAEAHPQDAPRAELVARAFDARRADESHRARLRVEMGRLRRLLRTSADLSATKNGFALVPRGGRDVVVLAPVIEDENAPVLALLADGEAWSSSALAIALGTSQRTVQRALDELAAAGKVQAFGRARARRWTTPPLPSLATMLLLPAPLATD
jgi:tetratricopeptide (TPR) repeat protein